MNKQRLLGVFALLLLLCLTLGTLCGCSGDEKQEEITSMEQLSGKRIGLLTGGLDGKIYAERFPDCEAFYYNNTSDLLAALLGNKVDFFLYDEMAMPALLAENKGIRDLRESVYVQEIAAAFGKGMNSADQLRADALRSEFDTFLAKLSADGKVTALKEEWDAHYEERKIDRSGLTGENGTVTLAVSGATVPFSFLKGEELSGFEIELFTMFCREYGYLPEITLTDFNGLVSSVSSGKADLAMNCISITEERSQGANFSKPYLISNLFPVVRTAVEKEPFFRRVSESFRKTFVVEHRWKTILSGVLITLAITLISAAAGTLLGFLLYLFSRGRGKLFLGVVNFFSRIVGGLPMVVLLMLMYYVLFAKASIPGFWVSVIAFTVSVTFSVFGFLRTSVLSIDAGQTEGAYSVGMTDAQTFLYVILPQALTQFLPNYKNLLVSLVQGTAIVGYIAVEDLTKVSDIIRARTYEAFFPLIATALIYLLIGWLLTALIRSAELKFDPHTRSEKKILRRFASEKAGSRSPHASVEDCEDAIRIEGLTKRFPTSTPINDLSLRVRKGDAISIIGPSGTGKSTLLRMLNMLETPTSGKIFVGGKDITAAGYPLHKMREQVGMVFQSFNLFANMTVIENVCFAPIHVRKCSPAEAYARGMELLSGVGLARNALSYPKSLSGGQKQRVAIARALAMEPDVILFDEPTSALDPTMVGEVQTVIKDLADKGYTMMMVTHDMKFAERVANRVIFLSDGGIYEEGTPEQIFRTPEKEKTRSFILRLKQLSFAIDSVDYDYLSVYTEIDHFALKNDLRSALRTKIKAVIEEFCFGILIPQCRASGRTSPDIRLDVDYSDLRETCCVRFAWDDFGIEKDEDFLISFGIVEHYAESTEWKSDHELEIQLH